MLEAILHAFVKTFMKKMIFHYFCNAECSLYLVDLGPFVLFMSYTVKHQSKKISNDQELIQSDPISCPQNQKGNN